MLTRLLSLQPHQKMQQVLGYWGQMFNQMQRLMDGYIKGDKARLELIAQQVRDNLRQSEAKYKAYRAETAPLFQAKSKWLIETKEMEHAKIEVEEQLYITKNLIKKLQLTIHRLQLEAGYKEYDAWCNAYLLTED